MKVVIVGGFSSTGASRLKTLAKEVKKSFPMAEVLLPEYFEYYGRIKKYLRKGTIPEYAHVVYQKIVSNDIDNDRPILIGYSLGGIVTRFLVEKINLKAKAVILVGAPNRGVKINFVEDKLVGKLVSLPCIRGIQPESNFLRLLNWNWHPESYYFIGSDRDERVPINSAIPMKEEGKFFILHTSHSGLIPKKAEMVPKSAIPIIIEILKNEIQT